MSYHSLIWHVPRYDEMNKYGFVADYGGVIGVFKLTETGFSHITTLKGHTSKYSS